MNLFWMLGFNNHLTILLGFITLAYFTNKNNSSFIIGCLSLFINLFVSHGAVIFIVISGFYLILTKQYKYLYIYIFSFLIILSIDFYTLSNYGTISNNNKLGLNVIFSIFPVAVLLGSVALNLKISFFLGFVFMAFQLFLLKKKYYIKNPEVFCLQLYIFATCLGLAINRWQFGANYFLNSRYKYFSILLIITFILAFYEYYYGIFLKYKKIFFLITFFYFLGANVLVYKLAFQKKNIITQGYNYYLKNKVGGLYVFEEDMYNVTNKQNIQAAKIMNSLVLDKYIYIDK